MKEKMRGKTIRWVLLFFAIMIVFTIPEGVSVSVEVWIYG